MSQDAKDLVRQGDLAGALASLQGQIRGNPADVTLRVFLFELLSMMGDWDRAGKQLDVLSGLDDSTLALVHLYRDGLMCEKLRGHIFSGATSPLVFGEPTDWMALLTQSVKVRAENESAGMELLQQAYDQAPPLSGLINGQAFEWIADADARLGPVLELVTNGKYYWVPFNRISRMQIEEPAHLRDKVWLPAHFTWSNEGEGFGLIPTRYVGTESVDNDRLRSAAETQWSEIADGMYTGLGQRMLATDTDDYPIMDVRELVINQEAD